MDSLPEALRHAFRMLFTLDPEMCSAVGVSLQVSTSAILLSCLMGLPLGAVLALTRFPGRTALVVIARTLMAVPTVVIGLVLYAVLSRQGPAGGLNLLFTPTAMIIGQSLLALPIVVTLTHAAIEAVDPEIRETAITLGAGPFRAVLDVIWEGRLSLLAAMTAAFGRVFSEIGISMMLGGNIRGFTRNITTGIALETGKGEFALGIALGIVLILVALGMNAAVQLLQGATEKRTA